MFQRILVPLDGSRTAEGAIAAAVRLARAPGGIVILLQVISAPGRLLDPGFGGGVDEFAEEVNTTLEAASSYLANLARGDVLGAIPVITVVTAGPVAGTILAIAREYRADLIVLCAHAHPRLVRWVRGRVASRVARHATIPVLLLHEHMGAPAPSSCDVLS